MSGIKGKIRGLAGHVLDWLGHFRIRTVFIFALCGALALFAVSLSMSNRIARQLIRTEYRDYDTAILRQAENAINLSMNDLTRLCYTLMSNPTIADYLSDDSFDGRTRKNSALKSEFDYAIDRIRDIKGIYLYDTNGAMVAAAGSKNYQFQDTGISTGLTFSTLRENDGLGYFCVSMPVFNPDDVHAGKTIGGCKLIISTEFLEKNIRGLLPSDDHFCVVLAGDGSAMLRAGNIPENVDLTDETGETGPAVLYSAAIPVPGWRVLFGSTQRQLYEGINLLQGNYLVTYLILGLMLLLLFVAVYAGVLRPIQRQITFMNTYARHRTGRIRVRSRNEMGELGLQMNRMLDDIAALTEENAIAREKILEAEYQKKQSELFAYRCQVNPHFLRNTFECIRGIALYHNVKDIAKITEALSELFSYSLMDEGYAAMREIRKHIECYTSIIRYRFDNRYDIRIDIAPESEEDVFPKMIIQPLVENAVFHGLETVETGGVVEVAVGGTDDGEHLRVVVADNGHGMTEAEYGTLERDIADYDRTGNFPAREHGVGVVNIYRRLRLFYGEALRFEIRSAPGEGTRITMLVPRELKKEERSGEADLSRG